MGKDVVDQCGDIGDGDGTVLVNVATQGLYLGLFLAVNPHEGEQVTVLDVGDAVCLAGGDVHLVE